jgi:NAD(P)-dependent dehydrogenase (short-subunit alcohol dehydrogenase family)
MDLEEQTAIVTGAGRGLGRAISLELAEWGADIVLADLDPDEMRETSRLIEERGRTALPLRTDLRDPDTVSETVERALAEFDSIEVLVNNSGIAGPTRACEETPIDEWDQTIAVNLRGAFLMTREVLPTMKRHGYGRIVNISSVTGKRPVAQRTPYAASKLGLIGFTRSLAEEVGKHDINVNAVCPGSVEGERIERVFEEYAKVRGTDSETVKRGEMAKSARVELVKPESVASVVSFLCSTASEQMTGQDLNVSAGKVMY